MADQQGQGGIQAARDTYHSPVDAGIGKAGCQRMALEFEPLPEGAAFGFRFHGQVGGGGEAAQGIVMGHSREAVSCRSRSGGQGIPGAADNVQINVVAEGGGLTELRLDAYGFTGFGDDRKAPVADRMGAVRPGAAAEDSGTAQFPAQDAESLFCPVSAAHSGRLIAGQQQTVAVPGKGAVLKRLAGITAGEHPQPGAACLKDCRGGQEALGERPFGDGGRQYKAQQFSLPEGSHGGNGHTVERNRQSHKEERGQFPEILCQTGELLAAEIQHEPLPAQRLGRGGQQNIRGQQDHIRGVGACLFDLLGEIFPAARRTSRVHPSGDGGNTNQVQHNDRSFLKAGGLNSVFYLTTNQFCRKWIHRKFWARNKNFFRQFSHAKRQGTISLPNFMPQRIFVRLIPGTTHIMEEKSHFSRHWFYGRIRA